MQKNKQKREPEFIHRALYNLRWTADLKIKPKTKTSERKDKGISVVLR